MAWGLAALAALLLAVPPAAPGLVDVQTLAPDVRVELKYATTDNFTGRRLYEGVTQCLLQRDAAEMLARAAAYLKQRAPELRLLAHDCARPHRVQLQLWAAVVGTPKQSYVANPTKGGASIHSFGCAIDLTLAAEGGPALDMGSPYDHFGVEAHPARETELRRSGKLTAEQHANRLLLREVMVRAGFFAIGNEWWHFDCQAPGETKKRYPLLP